MKERRKVELEVLEENNVRSELPPLDQGNKTHSAWEMESRRTHTHPFPDNHQNQVSYSNLPMHLSAPDHFNHQNQFFSSNFAMQPFHGILYSVPQHINQQNQVASSNLAMQGLLGMHLSMFLTTSKSGSFSPN
ncbi:hypothetical protein JHK82_017798 [Glycine max]|nr:hypothetical protein JHK82_017798 [Glycine max]